MVKISSIFVAFLENMNLKKNSEFNVVYEGANSKELGRYVTR